MSSDRARGARRVPRSRGRLPHRLPWERPEPRRGPGRGARRPLAPLRPGAAGGVRAAALVFVLGFLVFWMGGLQRGLWHIEEHRYAEVARVMAEPGGHWLVPRLNGEIYSDKPPLFFWIAALAERFAGLDPAQAAHLPSALGAALALAALFALAHRLYGRDVAIGAALVLATTALFLSLAQRANLDALLTGLTTLAFALAVAARDAFAVGARARGRGLGAASALAAGLGVLVKGPIALAVPGVALLAERVAAGARPLRIARGALAWLLVALLPGALWLAAAAALAGPDYVHTIAIHHAVGHPLGRVDKVHGFLYYPRVLPTAWLPWTLLLPAACWGWARWRRPAERAADRIALAWLVAPLALLALFPAKRNLYLAPVTPALALFVGRLLGDLLADPAPPGRLRHPLVASGGLALAVAAFLAGVGAIALGVSHAAGFDASLARVWPDWALLRGALGLTQDLLGAGAGALMAAAAVSLLRARHAEQAATLLGVAALAAVLLFASVVNRIETRGRSSRPFLERVALEIGDRPLADYGAADFAPNWILRRERVPGIGSREAAEAFLARHGGRACLVVTRRKLARHGLPAGTRVLLVGRRPLESDLLLVGPPGCAPALARAEQPPTVPSVRGAAARAPQGGRLGDLPKAR